MKRFLSLALLVAAMLSASVGASAKGRKAEVVVRKKGDVRKEIRFQDLRCGQGREADFRFKARPMRRCDMRRCEQFRREDPRFRDPNFRPRHHRHADRRHHHHRR